MSKKKFNFFITELLYNGHLQALGAVGVVYVSTILLLGRFASFDLLLIVYAFFEFIFVYDRYKDMEFDRRTNSKRTNHLEKYSSKIPLMLVLLAIVTVLGILIFSDVYTLLITLVIVLLGVMYPPYFKGLTKNIPMFKNIYVSGVYAGMVFYPLAYYSKIPEAGYFQGLSLLLFAYVFFESTINQVILDLKDVASDRSKNLLTLPAMVGRDGSIRILALISLLTNTVFVYFIVQLQQNIVIIVLAVTNLIIDMVVFSMAKKKNVNGYFLAAGKFSLWLLVVIVYWLLS